MINITGKLSSLPTGLQQFRVTDLGNTPVDVKTTNDKSGSVYGVNFINPNTVDVYVKIYDAEANDVTVGTTIPIETIPVPSEGSTIIAPTTIPLFDCENGISIAVVTEPVDGGTTDPTSDIIAHVRFV